MRQLVQFVDVVKSTQLRVLRKSTEMNRIATDFEKRLQIDRFCELVSNSVKDSRQVLFTTKKTFLLTHRFPSTCEKWSWSTELKIWFFVRDPGSVFVRLDPPLLTSSTHGATGYV